MNQMNMLRQINALQTVPPQRGKNETAFLIKLETSEFYHFLPEMCFFCVHN